MQQLKSCGVLVFRDEPSLSFLLMEHTQRLDLPKGHVDPGESEIECALRELEEETGIDLSLNIGQLELVQNRLQDHKHLGYAKFELEFSIS